MTVRRESGCEEGGYPLGGRVAVRRESDCEEGG